MSRWLIGCEFTARIRDAMRALGHDAWSCDKQPCQGDPRWHIQGDVLDVLDDGWDGAVFHPDCTYMTNASVGHLYRLTAKPGVLVGPARWVALFGAAEFFNQLKAAPIPKIAIENPIPHKYARALIGPYTQLVQPWMFGHTESKATCFWLKGLPELVPTNDVRAAMRLLPKREQQRNHYLPPTADRWKLRSATYEGIAAAIALQWAGDIREQSEAA